jgi:hypothetical protein
MCDSFSCAEATDNVIGDRRNFRVGMGGTEDGTVALPWCNDMAKVDLNLAVVYGALPHRSQPGCSIAEAWRAGRSIGVSLPETQAKRVEDRRTGVWN